MHRDVTLRQEIHANSTIARRSDQLGGYTFRVRMAIRWRPASPSSKRACRRWRRYWRNATSVASPPRMKWPTIRRSNSSFRGAGKMGRPTSPRRWSGCIGKPRPICRHICGGRNEPWPSRSMYRNAPRSMDIPSWATCVGRMGGSSTIAPSFTLVGGFDHDLMRSMPAFPGLGVNSRPDRHDRSWQQ